MNELIKNDDACMTPINKINEWVLNKSRKMGLRDRNSY